MLSPLRTPLAALRVVVMVYDSYKNALNNSAPPELHQNIALAEFILLRHNLHYVRQQSAFMPLCYQV